MDYYDNIGLGGMDERMIIFGKILGEVVLFATFSMEFYGRQGFRGHFGMEWNGMSG